MTDWKHHIMSKPERESNLGIDRAILIVCAIGIIVVYAWLYWPK